MYNSFCLKGHAQRLNTLVYEFLKLILLLGRDKGFIYAGEPFLFQGDETIAYRSGMVHLL